MTPFIESIATHQLLPPYQSDDVIVHAFLIEIDTDAIQKYCDKFFNIDQGGDVEFFYKPLDRAAFGIISVTEYPSLWSTLPNETLGTAEPVSASDHLTQNEVFAVIPVLRYRRTRSNLLCEPTVEWIQPLIIIDNPTSAFSGREVLGLEALHGTIEVANDPSEQGFAGKISLLSWQEFCPDEPQRTLPFLDIRLGAALTPDSPELKDSDTIKFLEEVREAVTLPDAGPDGAFPGADMKLAILKQYREAGDPLQAIYQAIVNVRCVYSNLREVALYAPSAISLNYSPSAMMDQIVGRFLGQELISGGLPLDLPEDTPPPPRRLPARLGFSFKADLNVSQLDTPHAFQV